MAVAWLNQEVHGQRWRTTTITAVVASVLLCGSSCATCQHNDAHAGGVADTPQATPPATPTVAPANSQAAASDEVSMPEPIVVDVPGSVVSLTMKPVPYGDGHVMMSHVEITWDLFDLFVYGDAAADDGHGDADALTRPTQPYIAMDRGFGRAGYPAISMSYKSAQQFCNWLSARTGKTFRLPRVSEWRAACVIVDLADLDAHAWHEGNADRTTHPVGSKQPNAFGLHDMLGNVAEWCVNDDGTGIVLGGSFRTQRAALNCTYAQESSPAWNVSDPQFPPSEWWLADAPFVGFRVVLEHR